MLNYLPNLQPTKVAMPIGTNQSIVIHMRLVFAWIPFTYPPPRLWCRWQQMKVLCMHCIVSPLASYNEPFLLWKYMKQHWWKCCIQWSNHDLMMTKMMMDQVFTSTFTWGHDDMRHVSRNLKKKNFLAIFACWMKRKKGSNILNEWMQILHLVNQMWLK